MSTSTAVQSYLPDATDIDIAPTPPGTAAASATPEASLPLSRRKVIEGSVGEDSRGSSDVLGSTGSPQDVARILPRLPNMTRAPAFVPLPFTRQLLHQFEGTIEHVGVQSFTARLEEIGSGLVESADFDIAELNEDQVGDVKVGAVFYWNIGLMTWSWGQRESYSQIVFRRFPLLSRKGIAALKSEDSAFDELFRL